MKLLSWYTYSDNVMIYPYKKIRGSISFIMLYKKIPSIKLSSYVENNSLTKSQFEKWFPGIYESRKNYSHDCIKLVFR